MSDFTWIIQVSIASIILILLVHHLADFAISYFSQPVIHLPKSNQKYIDARQDTHACIQKINEVTLTREEMKQHLKQYVRHMKDK